MAVTPAFYTGAGTDLNFAKQGGNTLGAALVIGTNDAFDVEIEVNGLSALKIKSGAPADSLFIDALGKVGIGTVSPQNKLDVSGALVIGSGFAGVQTAPTDGLLVEGNVGFGTPNPSLNLAFGVGTVDIGIESTDGSDTGLLRLLSTNSATSSRGAYLSLAGNEHATSGDILFSTGAGGDIDFFAQTGGSAIQRMKIKSGGNVGIGITAPADLLSIGLSNGQQTSEGFATTEVTGMSGATVTATNLIPAGSFVVGVTIRVTTEVEGATTFDIGDGSDVDRWGAAIILPAGTTTTIVDFTADGFGQFVSANDIVLTANVANFTAGAVRITVHFMSLTAATA